MGITFSPRITAIHPRFICHFAPRFIAAAPDLRPGGKRRAVAK